MEVIIKLNPTLSSPVIEIHTAAVTEEIKKVIEAIHHQQLLKITGTLNQKIYLLNPKDILCFFTEDKKVWARTTEQIFFVSERLYKLEELLIPYSFIRISQSTLINIEQIKHLEMSFNGTICVRLKDNSTEYASRRYVPKIKQHLHL